MSFLTGLAASVVEWFIEFFVRKLIAYVKEQKAAYELNAEISKNVKVLTDAVKVAKTPEDYRNAAKNIADYISKLPPK